MLTSIESRNDLEADVRSRWFYVFHPMGEDWEQLSVAFRTFDEAKEHFDRINRGKYPCPRIMVELSYSGYQ